MASLRTKRLAEKYRNKSNLAHMSELIQGLAGEEMNGADLPKHAPPLAVRRKNEVLIVVRYILGTGIGWPAGEIGVMVLQELGRHGRRSRHHDVNEAEPEVHERAIGTSHGRQGVVRHSSHVGQVSDYGPWFWAWREGEPVAVGAEVEQVIEKDG
jgi:hypothetical protein